MEFETLVSEYHAWYSDINLQSKQTSALQRYCF